MGHEEVFRAVIDVNSKNAQNELKKLESELKTLEDSQKRLLNSKKKGDAEAGRSMQKNIDDMKRHIGEQKKYIAGLSESLSNLWFEYHLNPNRFKLNINLGFSPLTIGKNPCKSIMRRLFLHQETKVVMETLWVILVGLVTAVALFLFYCKGWWPSTWWRGFCFVMLTLIFTPIITLPIQWWVWKYCHNGIIEGSGGHYDPYESTAAYN